MAISGNVFEVKMENELDNLVTPIAKHRDKLKKERADIFMKSDFLMAVPEHTHMAIEDDKVVISVRELQLLLFYCFDTGFIFKTLGGEEYGKTR